MSSDRKLTYGRTAKEYDLLPRATATIAPPEESQLAVAELPRALRGYQKTDGAFSYSIICVISGGERKERDFLRELIRHKDIHSLKVVFISESGQGLQPYQMQQKWAEIHQSGVVDSSHHPVQLEDVDKVFLLTDVDEFYDQLLAIDGRENGGLRKWIISNPCFEIWLYYCFRNAPTTELQSLASVDVAKRSQEMKHLGNTLVPGGMNPIRAFERMEEGVRHSREHYAEDEHSIPVLYATQMHEMAQFIMDAMNRRAREYEEYVRSKQVWRELKKS